MTVTPVTQPVVTGQAKKGSALHTTDGEWTFDLDRLEFTYSWLRCDALGANCVTIGGATSNQYVLTAADVGHTIESRVDANEVADSPNPPPPDDKLLWAPPTLSSPTVRALTQASHSIAQGGGGDLRVTAATEDLSTAIGEIKGYNDIEMIGGKIAGGSSGAAGHIIPRENTGTFHLEGWRVALTVPADALATRWRTPIVQIQACYIEVTRGGSSFHADGYQTQEQISDDLRMDRCTIKTDYQGILLLNEPQNQGPARSRLTHQTLSRILFLVGAQGNPTGTFFFKAFPQYANTDPIGLTEMYDVWMPLTNAVYNVEPNGSSWVGWDGQPNRYGCFLETKMHPTAGMQDFLRFSTSADTVPVGKPLAGQQCGDCGVRGDGGIWLYSTLAEVPADVGAPSDAGRLYVSPGYQ